MGKTEVSPPWAGPFEEDSSLISVIEPLEKLVTITGRAGDGSRCFTDDATTYPQLLTMAVMSLTWFSVLRFCFI